MKKGIRSSASRLTFGVLASVAATTVTAPVMAQSIGEVVQRQNELSRLDHTIQRNDRMMKIQEQELEFATLTTPRPEPEPEPQSGRVVQEQFFGQRPDGMMAPPPAPEKSPEELRMERILSALDDAVVTEVFLPKGSDDPDAFVAVIDLGDISREVRVGSSVEGWQVTAVDLNRVELRNREFNQTRVVYQAR